MSERRADRLFPSEAAHEIQTVSTEDPMSTIFVSLFVLVLYRLTRYSVSLEVEKKPNSFKFVVAARLK